MEQFNAPPPIVPPTQGPPPVTPPPISQPPVQPPIMPPPQSNPSRFKSVFGKLKLKYILPIPIVLILAVLIFGYIIVAKGQTKIGENLQDQIWQTLIDNSNQETKDLEVNITYTDKGSYDFKPSNFIKAFEPDMAQTELDSMDQQYSFTIADLSIGGAMKSYLNISDKDKPKVDFEGTGFLKNDGKSFEASTGLKLSDTEAYTKYDYNPDLENLINKNFGPDSSDEYKNQWMQITEKYQLESLQQMVKYILFQEDASRIKDDDAKKVEQSTYQKLLRAHRLFDIKSLKGISLIDGKPVLHYELVLNKTKLSDYVKASLDEAFSSEYDKDIKDFAEQINTEILAKININNYEVWVGATDHKLYKSVLVIDALSVSKTADYIEKTLNDPNSAIRKSLSGSLESARDKARDAKRLADMRMVASALELYYNDKNEYPKAENGKPIGTSPDYLLEFPTSPSPADGTCTDYSNTYWYTQKSATSYTLEFCLGGVTGGAPAGNNVLTEQGFQNYNPNGELMYPPEPEMEPVVQTESDPLLDSIKSAIIETIRGLNFDAKIKIEVIAKNYGQVRNIEAPKDFKKAPSYNEGYYIDDVSY